MVARTHIFIIMGLTRYLPETQPVPFNQQVLMWFSGLRGAVAFALAVQFLENPDFPLSSRSSVFATTVLVIVFTVLVFGGLTPFMLRWLKICPEEQHGHTPLPTTHKDVEAPADDQIPISEKDLEQPLLGWLYRFDAKYMKSLMIRYIRPHFTHADEEQIKIQEVVRRRDSVAESRRTSLNHSSFQLNNLSQKNLPVTNVENNERERMIKTSALHESPKQETSALDIINLN